MPQFLICKMGIITIAIPRSGGGGGGGVVALMTLYR